MKQAIEYYKTVLQDIEDAGLTKEERIITSPQGATVSTTTRDHVLNMCANNYLGLSANKELIHTAKTSYDTYGFGLSSVRFICGTQTIHKELEKRISRFIGMEDTILFSSCFDANGGLFEALLTAEDAIISDSLNHASIIDGIRLCKAQRFRYENSNMDDLRSKLIQAKDARIRMIATDGVFSMDGSIANLQDICDLAEEYNALVMVDDSHATGFVGKHGKGTPEYCDVMGRVDIITSTFGKAMGGASGGFVAASAPVVKLLRQRSRPYLFSNSLAPSICAATIKTLDLLEESTALCDTVQENTSYFRKGISEIGLDVLPGEHPIVPVMLYDARIAAAFAARMLELGVYVVGFSYPVVPMGKARIRTQVSAAHTHADLDFAIECFAKVKAEMNI